MYYTHINTFIHTHTHIQKHEYTNVRTVADAVQRPSQGYALVSSHKDAEVLEVCPELYFDPKAGGDAPACGLTLFFSFFFHV